tara:strand:+ start:21735 stop:24182 length:2448 start_codon:yes stop_codon:yes gene_type:complete
MRLIKIFLLTLFPVLSLSMSALPEPAAAQMLPRSAGSETASESGADSGAEEGGKRAAATSADQSSLDLLLDVIEDAAARNRLIEQLRDKGAEDAVTPDGIVETLADGTGGAEPAETLSFGRRIAIVTQQMAEGLAENVTGAWSRIGDAPNILDGLRGDEIAVLWGAMRGLALVIAATVVVFVALRWIGKSIYARMGSSAHGSGMARTVLIYIFSAFIDALNVVLAWAAGYALATLVLGDFGQIAIRQTLYLNAFLMVEMLKVAIRLTLSPAATNLRPVPLSDRAAKYLTSRLSLLVAIGGYGQMLVVPIINSNVSYAAGRAVSTLVALAVLGFAVWLVLRNRRAVTNWMLRPPTPITMPQDERAAIDLTLADPMVAVAAEGLTSGSSAAGLADALNEADSPARRHGTLHFFASHWHWPALAYLFVMFLIVLVRPGDAVFRSFVASGQVALIGLLGVFISGLISRAVAHGVTLPETVSERMPLLENRLNRFVPRALSVLRLVILAVVVFVALNVLGMIDLRGWMASQFGIRMTSTIFSVAAVLAVAFILWLALTSWVDYRLNPEYGQVATARERTLLSLLRNAATIALIVITIMFVLSEVGLDIAPLLASAGVLGLAIGFGAQKMVQDIITGIFIQFENAMNVGDIVTLSGTTGTVERLTIRSVSLRDLAGAFHIIPFSSVDMVTNYVRDFGYFICDMGVAYRENVEEVKQAMFDAFEELRENPDQRASIMGDLEWFGLNSFGDSAVVLRARIKCQPGSQWGVGRAYNAVLKRVFDERDIEIPFPYQTIVLGEAKDGSTQTLHIASDDLDRSASES